ncbi:MAG: hypothetical protein JXQ83_09785, partial [Candidatus Glassbacteria bacterium]|nr:hypothetical protein [Candidatus Glassbacteria bacterium]
MKKIALVFVVVMSFLARDPLYPKEYFVSEQGVDDAGRDGSLEQPWRQLRWVLGQEVLGSGDTLTAGP